VSGSGVHEIYREISGKLGGRERIQAAEAHAMRRRFSRQIKEMAAKEVVALADLLVQEDRFPSRFMAYALLHHHEPAICSLKAKDVRRLGRGIDSWYDVDTFGGEVSGQVWRRKGITDKEVLRWTKSKDLWWRRNALVSTVALNMKSLGGSGDSRRTLLICEQLVDDREDMVVKGLSWALRALVQWDHAGVESFLNKHSNRLAARVKREVFNKLTTGLKNPRKIGNPK